MKNMMNSFAVSGFVAMDAQVHNFDTASVARFPLSVSRKETVAGTETRKSALVNIEAWRKNTNTAEFEIMKKGNLVTVEGYLAPDEWTDAQNVKHQKIVFNAVKVYLTPDKQ